jgi:peptidoglycan/LPS O-acetylase OafA/YrhL
VFHTLDALRGIAALGVVAGHLSFFLRPLAVPGSYLAVDLFFMMSGVVIAHAYDERFLAGMTTAQFMRARFIRLYPLYLLGTVLGAAVAVAMVHGSNPDRWSLESVLICASLAIMLVPNLFGIANSWLYPLDIPCWSLLFEILVNLAYRVVWTVLDARRLLIICLLSGVGVALTIAMWGHIDQGSTSPAFLRGVVRTIFGFSVGVLIARKTGHAPRRKSAPVCLLICAAVVVALIGWPHGASRAFWDASCVLLLFPLIVYTGTVIDPPVWLRPIATFLGLTSYAIYILHGPLAKVLFSIFGRLSGRLLDAAAPYTGILVIGVLFLLGWLIDRIYDVPLRRTLSRALPSAPRPALSASPHGDHPLDKSVKGYL